MSEWKEKLEGQLLALQAWWQGISVREQRMLLGAVAALVLSVAFIAYMKVSVLFEDLNFEAEELEKAIDKDLHVLNKRTAWERRQDRLADETAALQASLLKSDSLALAAAELQGLIEQIAGSSGLDLDRLDRKNPDTQDKFTEISWGIRLRCTPTELRNFVYGLESNRVYMIVELLQVRVRDTKNPSDIDVTMTVGALMKTPPEAQAESSGEG